MTQFVSQGTATAGALADVTASVGGRWTPHPDYPGDLLSTNTTVRSGGAVEEALYVCGTSSAQDSSFQASVQLPATSFGGHPMGIAYNVDTTKFKTFYLARFSSGTLLELLRVEGSNTTTLGSATYALDTVVLNGTLNGAKVGEVHKLYYLAGTNSVTLTATETASSLPTGRIGIYMDGRSGTNTAGPWVALSTATATHPNLTWGINDAAFSLGSLVGAGAGSITGFSGDGAVTLGALTVEGSDVSVGGTVYGTAEAEILPLTSEGEITTGVGGSADVTLPLLVCEAYGVISANDQVLGSLTVAGSGATAILGAAAATIRLIEATASGTVAHGAFGDLAIGPLTVSASGVTTLVGSGAPELHPFESEGVAVLGVGGAGAIALSGLTTTGQGFVNITGTAALTLPMLVVAANVLVGDSAVDVVIVMNTGNAAVTEYSGWTFDSFAQLGGITYGIGDGGIVPLEGSLDGAAAIAAFFQTGKMDGGSDSTKRPTDLYATGQIAGELEATVTGKVKGKEASYSYVMPHGDDESDSRKVNVGRGFESVYLQYKVANIEGADFKIDTLTGLAQVTGRRA